MTSEDMHATRARRLQLGSLIAIVACGGLAAWSAAGFFSTTVDDAYISIRYAANLVDGHGLVWNAGEHVEGFSNPTWVLVLAGLLAAGADPMVGGKLLGLVCWAGVVVVVGVGARRLARPDTAGGHLATVLGSALLAVSYPGAFWASQNLETAWYALLLASALVRLQHELARGGAPWSAGLAGLAAISRPEAPLLVLPLVLARAHAALATRAWRPAGTWAAIFAVPTLGYLAFRLVRFGDVFPNTYHHKGRRASWEEVAAYVQPWLETEAFFVAAGAVGLAVLVGARRNLLVAGVLGAGALFVAYVGGDWMRNQRFLVPVLPVLALAAGAGFAVLARHRAGGLAVAGLGVLVGLQAWTSLPVARAALADGEVVVTERGDGEWGFGSWREALRGSNAVVAAWLLTRVPPDATLAYSEIGLTGYAGGWEVLDLIGLTSREMVGATGLDTEGKLAWVRSQEPEWMVLKNAGPPQIRLLREDPWVHATYEVEVGPKGLLVARHRRAARITDAGILTNLARATERCPRVLQFHRERVAWTAALGDASARQASCDALATALPAAAGLVRKCTALVQAGGERPRAAPEDASPPWPEVVTWIPAPRTLANEQVKHAPSGALALSREPGQPAAGACVEEVFSLHREARVTALLRAERILDDDVWRGGHLELRYLDEGGRQLPGGLEGGARQIVATLRGDGELRVDEDLTPPSGARDARLCARLNAAEGRLTLTGVRVGLASVARGGGSAAR